MEIFFLNIILIVLVYAIGFNIGKDSHRKKYEKILSSIINIAISKNFMNRRGDSIEWADGEKFLDIEK